jgi:hypothetical protein
MQAAPSYFSDIRNHQNTAGAALFSVALQQGLIDFLGQFPIPYIEALDIVLDPSIPIFDPNPLGWYDGD